MISERDRTEAERGVLRAAGLGSAVDLGTGDQEQDDPAQGKNWGPERTVRAELLADLLSGVLKPKVGPPRTVRLTGARIVGVLDLDYATLCCPLMLWNCYLDEGISLVRAEASLISLISCRMPAMIAPDLRTSRDLAIAEVHCSQLVLVDARIGGNLNLGGTTLSNPDGWALVADRITVDGSLYCVNGFSAEGQLRLGGATIGAGINLDGATVSHPQGLALEAPHLTVGQTVVASNISVTGGVRLHSASIDGDLILDGASLTRPGGVALDAAQLTVKNTMSCRDGVSAAGEVVLSSAEIGKHFDMSGAKLINPEAHAFYALALRVQGGMLCRGLSTEGEVLLLGTHIGGQLNLNAARLANKGGRALVADGIAVGHGVHCTDGFAAEGETRLPGAHISGNLEFENASLLNPGGRALTADQITVDGDVRCHSGTSAEGEVRLPYSTIEGSIAINSTCITNPHRYALATDHTRVRHSVILQDFSAEGEVRLSDIRVGSQLALLGAKLSNPNGNALMGQALIVEEDLILGEGTAALGNVHLTGAQVGKHLLIEGATLAGSHGALTLQSVKAATLVLKPDERPTGIIDLSDASVGTFIDDQATWPEELVLNGFSYERLGNDAIGIRDRLNLLRRNQGGYTPQIYERLATVYRQAGNEEAARRVLIEKHRQRRRKLNPLSKAWNWLLYWTVGYGYRPWWAAIWLTALVTVGSLVFWRAYPQDIVPATATPPTFNPVVYTLDVLLPIVDLGQQQAWLPEGGALYLLWALIGCGWLLTTAVVAGVTRVLKRE